MTGKRRRYPRRKYDRKVGVLHQGQYSVGKGEEIGEGGIRLTVDMQMKESDFVILSFQISREVYVITKAEIRYCKRANSYGIQYHDIQFEKKRAIRDYIAEKTEAEAENEKRMMESGRVS